MTHPPKQQEGLSGYGHYGGTFNMGRSVVHIDSWGAGPFSLKVNGRRVLFEDSEMFGPVVINKSTLDPAARQPAEKSLFWEAYSRWVQGGRQTRGWGKVLLAVAPTNSGVGE